MLKRLMMIGLLVISVVAMLGTEANGTCTCTKIIGGSCFYCCTDKPCFWGVKGLLCTLSGLTTQGGGKTLACSGEGVCPSPGVSDINGNCINPTNSSSISRKGVTGLLACINKGGNFSVGNTPQTFTTTSLEGFTSLDKQVKNGKFKNVSVAAMPTDLSSLTPFCPGGQTWTAFDVALCDAPFESFADVQVDGTSDGQLRVVCTGSCSAIDFVVSGHG